MKAEAEAEAEEYARWNRDRYLGLAGRQTIELE